MIDLGQASLRGGVPRHDSPRIRAESPPPEFASLGSLYLVVQGAGDRDGRSFIDTVVSSYYSSESSSIVNGLTQSLRQAAYAVGVASGAAAGAGRVGATGAVVSGHEMYVAQVAPSQVYVLRETALNALPPHQGAVRRPDTGDDAELDSDLDLYRTTLKPNDVVVLASTDLRHQLTEREIRGLLTRQTAQEAAHDLCALVAQRGGDRCEALVLRVASADLPRKGALPVGPAVGDTRSSSVSGNVELAPTGGDHRRPAVRHRSEWDVEAVPGATARRPRAERPSSGLVSTVLTLMLLLPVYAVRGVRRLFGSSASTPSRGVPLGHSDAMQSPVNDDWRSLRELRSAGPGGPVRRGPQVGRGSGPPLDYYGSQISSRRDPLLHRRRRSAPGPGVMLLSLSLVLLIVMVVVLVMRNSGAPPAPVSGSNVTVAAAAVAATATPNRAADLLSRAEEKYRGVRGRAPGENRSATLLLLRDAKDLANQAGTADVDRTLAPDINRLLNEIGREEDRLNLVRKLVPSATIGEFDAAGVGVAANPMAVRDEQEFVIDATTGRLVQFATAKNGTTVLRRGDVVGTVTVGEPVAVVNRALGVLVIDNRHNVFTLQPDQSPRLLSIVGTDQWKKPVAFSHYGNNLYVLDPGANKIFKYQATAGGFEVAPYSYVDPREGIDLSQAVSLAIDGDVYVLLADGTVIRLRGGRKESFTINGLEGEAFKPTRILTSAGTESLYLVDASNRRIMEIDKRKANSGTFVRQFRYAGSDDFFADIRDIWISETDGKLIVLGKDSLRAFVVPKIRDGATPTPADRPPPTRVAG